MGKLEGGMHETPWVLSCGVVGNLWHSPEAHVSQVWLPGFTIVRRSWKWILAEETELTAGGVLAWDIGFPQSHCWLPSHHYRSSFVSPCAPCHDFLSPASLTEVSEALDQSQPFSLLSFYSRAFPHSNRKSATITEVVDGRLGVSVQSVCSYICFYGFLTFPKVEPFLFHSKTLSPRCRIPWIIHAASL